MRLFLLILFVVTCWSTPLAFAAAPNNDGKLSSIKEKIDSIQAWLKDARNEHDTLYQSLKASEQSITELDGKTTKISKEVGTRTKRLADLKSQEAQLQAKKVKSQESIAEYVRSSYMLGKQEYIKLLLNAEDPASLSRMLNYYDYFNRAHSSEIAEFNTTISQLKALQATITNEQQELQKHASTLQQKQQALAQQRAARAKLMAELDARINHQDDALKKLLQDRVQLEKLIASMKSSSGNFAPSSDKSPFTAWKGKLAWPLKGTVLHRFGDSRVQNKVFWEGLTVGAPVGTSVHAVYHGRVVFVDSLRGFGLLIIVDHGNGYMSLYAHNQTALKANGAQIQAGDIIATTGSGDNNESGLYFEIRYNGKPQNPTLWLAKKP